MARPQYRRRQHTDEASHQDHSPTNGRKRQRIDEPSQSDHQGKRPQPTIEHHTSWQYPPEFWDKLSKVPLIHSALKELNRRTCTRPSCPPPTGLAQDLSPTATRELAQFARHGGPDLCGLRGYPPATGNNQPAGAMSSSRSRATQSTDPTTLPTTSGTIKPRSTIPYHPGFEQHLTDHFIYPLYRSRKPELADTRAALAVRRPSLSSSSFSEGAFETFQDSNAQAKDEDDVKAHVVPTIIGARQTDHPSAMNTPFRNLEPITDGTLAPANPDLYYGAYPEELDQSIRNKLAGHIIPSTMEDKPMAPNFFLEVKGPNGSLAVATRQARYDGAIGARAVHSLQNYGGEEPQYDNQAHTYSSIYHGGQLQLFAHHVTAPTTKGGRPKYHMTQVRSFSMTDTRETFVQGATAFRNARDLAKRHRDGFIQAANTRAAQAAAAAAAAQEDLSPTSHEFHDADDALQQHTADASNYALEDDSKATTIPHHLYAEDRSQEKSQEFEAPGFNDPSFASSFASSLKRPRQSLSPPGGSQSSKRRKLPNTARGTDDWQNSWAFLVTGLPKEAVMKGRRRRDGRRGEDQS